MHSGLKQNHLESILGYFFAHSNQFILLNVQEKAQKADGTKKLMKKFFFQRQFSTILGLKMSCLQNKNYLNANIRCIWHIQNSFVSKSSIKKVKMLVKSAKIDEKNRKNFEKKNYFTNFFTGGGPFLA